jgi:hypothetical protein
MYKVSTLLFEPPIFAVVPATLPLSLKIWPVECLTFKSAILSLRVLLHPMTDRVKLLIINY